MISCAAVQKLERYGQLGLKRHSVDDYVQSSLKDSKRANLFALTHLDTWRECRDYMCPSAPSMNEAAVSESLMYAMSFTTALVGEHCHAACRAAISPSPPSANDVPIFDADAPAQRWEHCCTLVGLLKDITVAMHRQRARVWTQHGAATLTQAMAHYCSTLTDTLFAIATLYSLATVGASSHTRVTVVTALSADVFCTLTAATRHLKRCVAHYPVESLFQTRTLPAMVRQLLHKQEQQNGGKNGKQGHQNSTADGAPKESAASASSPSPEHTSNDGFSFDVLAGHLGVSVDTLHHWPPLITLLLAASLSSASCALVLDGLPLFQRLSLLYAFVSLDDASTHVSRSRRAEASGESPATAPCLLDEIPTEARTQLQNALCTLLSPHACNRATRFVVYYRGDDVRLLQNSVRQASEYALHTFSTTAPIEPSLVTSLSSFLEAPADHGRMKHASEQQANARARTLLPGAALRCALFIASWIASAPLFFHSFCMDSTWSVFAREQRRMAILTQMKARRERKVRAQKRTRTGDGDGEAGSDAAMSEDGASDTASVSSQRSHGGASVASTATAGGGLLDTMSLASRHSSIGLLSLASRASVLSTLSKRSQASYLSFLSVLKPEGGAADGEGGSTTMDEPKLHESADGNTNLPLILLEELTLAVYSVMEGYEAHILDRFGLRELAWQSIGHMLALVQGSMHRSRTHSTNGTRAGRDEENGGAAQTAATLLAVTASIPTPLFNLGYDTRYNHGLGYEALGLLFAKVLSPQLEGEDGEENEASSDRAVKATVTSAAESGDDDVYSTTASVALTENALPTRIGGRRTTRGRPYVSAEKDAQAVLVRVEAALSQCLATYEDVAPQVVDANLPTILRIAARAAALTGEAHRSPTTGPTSRIANAGDENNNDTTPHVLLAFLSDITQRLGRGNQVPVLLDAVLKPESATHAETSVAGVPEDEVAAGAEAEEVSLAALQRVFAQPMVHLALTEACAQSMDPETLLTHAITYVAALSSATDDDEDARDATPRAEEVRRLSSPTYVLCVLQLVAALLEGVMPTSATAAAVLERSTEMELLLSSFLLERLAPLLRTDQDQSDGKADSAAAALRSWRFGTVKPRTAARELLLHTLYTLFLCRQVTRRCLQDLGAAPVTPYLEMLEETLWQCQSQVGVLAGSALDLNALQDMFASSTLSLRADPHFDVNTLLTCLAVQRLSLAHAVSTMLGVGVGPAGEARLMAHAVLDTLTASESEDASENVAAVRMANLLSAEDWQSLCAFGKPKRVRQRLISLLRASFDAQVWPATSATLTTNAAQVDGAPLPLWLSRCLSVDSGAVLRALVTLLLATDTEDVVAALSTPVNAMKSHRLVVAVCALRDIYVRFGHVPYWCSLLDTVVGWLEAWYKAHTRQGAADAPVHTALLNQLLLLTRDCLVLERRAAEVCRQALFELDKTTAADGDGVSAAAPNAPSTSTAQACRNAYTAALGVPVTISARLTSRNPSHNTDETDQVEDEEADVERQETRSLLHAAASLFSPGSRWTRLLWLVSSGGCGAGVGVDRDDNICSQTTAMPRHSMQTTAVSLIAFSYVNALQSAQVWQRRRGSSGRAAETAPTATTTTVDASAFVGFRYVQHVVAQFTQRLAHRPTETAREQQARVVCGGVLSHFLSLLEGKPLVVPVSGGGGGSRRQGKRTPLRTREVTSLDQKKDKHGAEKRDADDDEQDDRIDAPEDADQAEVPSLSASAVMSQLLQSWLALLHAQLMCVMEEPPAPATALSSQCAWVTALYGHLLDAFLGFERQSPTARTPAAGEKRARGENEEQPASSRTTATTPVNAASDRARQFALALQNAGNDDPVAAHAADDTPVHRTRLAAALASVVDTDGTGTPRSSLFTRLVCGEGQKDEPLGRPARIPGLTMAWLLQQLYEVLCPEQSANRLPSTTASLQRALLAVFDEKATSVCRTSAAAPVSGSVWTRGIVAPCVSAAVANRLAQELVTLPHTLRVMRANAVPAALHHYMHALFQEALPASATAEGLAAWLGSDADRQDGVDAKGVVDTYAMRAERGHALLCTAADALLTLSTVPGMRMVSLVYVLTRLMWASTALKVPFSAARRTSLTAGRHGGKRTLWSTLLRLCALPTPALTHDNAFLDAAWWFVMQLLEVRTESTASSSIGLPAAGATAAGRAALASHVLSFEEVMLVLRLFTQAWLRNGVFWRTPALLPNVMAALFDVVLRGVQAQRFPPHTILNALASFLFQLVKDVETRRRQRLGKASDADGDEHVHESNTKMNASSSPRSTDTVKLGQQSQAKQARAALETASTPSQYLALAAATSAMFEVAQSYVSVFTTYSNDMDYLPADLLKALSRVHLPRERAPPIAYHAGTKIVSPGMALHTYSDLAFTAVGSDESKALLRQAALRIEEEQEDQVDEATRAWQPSDSGKSAGTARGGHRNIFQVNE